MRAKAHQNNKVERARLHLWATTFVIMAALVLAVVYTTGNERIEELLPFLPAGRLRLSLAVLVLAFLTYVLDRERHLRRLAERLTEERVESTRLQTRLEYLTQLQRERDTNAALLDGAADGVAVADGSLRLVRFNAAMEALTGVAESSAVDGYAPAVLRFSDAEGRVLQDDAYPLRAALEAGQPLAGLELRLHVGTVERWVSGTFSPIGGVGTDREGGDRAAEGAGLVMVVLRDITAAKEMQAMQRDFVSIVSHELRTPLTAIKGFAKTLIQRGESLPAETRQSFLATVSDQADRLARLVDDLLQVSRIEAQRLRMEIEPQQPGEIVQDLLHQFRSKWMRPMEVDVPASVPAVAADRDKLEEVLINLIDNAVKYSPEGSPVRIVARETSGEVEIAIEDRGAGISSDDAAKLFQKFQRLSTPATRDVGGSGLGLYIVKGLVDAMGGRVWIESAPGQGSTFAFSMPVAAEIGKTGLQQVGA